MKGHALAAIVAAASFVCAGIPAFASEDQEIATAAQHAGMAAGSNDLKMVQTHLHHVVNCLVGPDGKGFDGSFGNPCKGQGNGAIPDASGPKDKLQSALAMANDGLAATDAAAARKDATEAQAMLKAK